MLNQDPGSSEDRQSPPRISNLSIITLQASAIDVCYSVYGDNPTSSDAIERFYEANASKSSFLFQTSESNALGSVRTTLSSDMLALTFGKLRKPSTDCNVAVCD
jgi:hypothetical protein